MNENRLEDLKDEKNLKSKELAKIFGVHESTYSEWEHNKIPIPTKRLLQIAEFYNISIDYMLKLSNERKNIPGNVELNLEKIGHILKDIRLEMNISLRSLGKILNISFSSLGSYERGEHLIQSETLITLCKISNYSIDYILGRSNQKLIKKLNK